MNIQLLIYLKFLNILFLSKILKYTFLFCAKNNNKFPFEFKETKLFKNNSQIFEKYSY